jgi:hypothetical protein
MNDKIKRLAATAIGLGLASLIVGSSTEAAVLTEWGAEATTSVADCPNFCTNFNFGPHDGGQGNASDSSSVSEFRGSADAEASLTGGLSVPVLRAKGNANPSLKGAFGSAFGSQGYTYNGPSTTLTLDATLTASLVDPGSTSFGRVSATVVVFEVSNYEFFSDLGTLISEAGATPIQQIDDLGDALMEFDLFETGSIDETQSVSFEATDGDQFYIWALLDANAVSSSTEGIADAFNTLGMTFEDPTGLTHASVTIPEPTTLTLTALTLLGLNYRRRKLM